MKFTIDNLLDIELDEDAAITVFHNEIKAFNENK